MIFKKEKRKRVSFKRKMKNEKRKKETENKLNTPSRSLQEEERECNEQRSELKKEFTLFDKKKIKPQFNLELECFNYFGLDLQKKK